MSYRSEASILAGRRRTVVLAALVASSLIFLMFAPGGVALAKEGGGGGGGVNIQAGDCSQIQVIFIQQVLDEDKDKNKDDDEDKDKDNDKDDDKDKDWVATTTGKTRGTTSPEEAAAKVSGELGVSEERVDEAAAKISRGSGGISQ
jgi:hypothetical protein